MSALDDLQAASDAFAERLVGVTVDQWDLPTPCPEWSVRDLFAHVAGGNQFAVALLAGASAQEARAAARTLDLAAGAQEAFRVSAAAQLAAFSEPGAFERTCHHPVGDLPGAQFIGLRIGDLIVHAWDLATAVGGDHELGDGLCSWGCGCTSRWRGGSGRPACSAPAPPWTRPASPRSNGCWTSSAAPAEYADWPAQPSR